MTVATLTVCIQENLPRCLMYAFVVILLQVCQKGSAWREFGTFPYLQQPTSVCEREVEWCD